MNRYHSLPNNVEKVTFLYSILHDLPLEAAREIYDVDCVVDTIAPLLPHLTTPEAIHELSQNYRKVAPDIKYTVKDVISQDNMVWVLWQVHGHQLRPDKWRLSNGEYMLYTNPKALISVEGISIIKFNEHGRICYVRQLQDLLDDSMEEYQRVLRTRLRSLHNLSHELRTPLHAILNSTDSLHRHVAPANSKDVSEDVDLIETSSALLLSLTNDLLDLERAKEKDLSIESHPVDIEKLCRRVAKMATAAHSHAAFSDINSSSSNSNSNSDIRNQKKKKKTTTKKKKKKKEEVEITKEEATTTKTSVEMMLQIDESFVNQLWQVDETHLIQVLLNIVGNAVKNTFVGQITIAATPTKSGSEILFKVADTGIGIPIDKRQHIMAEFSQLWQKGGAVGGSGLGLALVARIIEAWHSDLDVEHTRQKCRCGAIKLDDLMKKGVHEVCSQCGEGVGVTFVFSVPCVVCDSHAQEGRTTWSALSLTTMENNNNNNNNNTAITTSMKESNVLLKNLRIVVCDDNAINVRILNRILVELPCAGLESFYSGADAVAYIAEHDNVNVLVTDLHMPSMDGVEVAQRVRALPHGHAVTIVVATADNSKHTLDIVNRAEIIDYLLTKPYSSDDVETLLVDIQRRAIANHDKEQKQDSNDMSAYEYLSLSHTLEPCDVTRGEKVGSGSSGVVYRGLVGSRVVAIKELKAVEDERARREFSSEIQAMIDLPVHPNVVQIIGVIVNASLFAIVTEFMEGGALDAYVYALDTPIADELLAQYAFDAVSSLEWLHRHGLIHRDVAARNCLLDAARERVKLSDFGLARRLEEEVYYQETKTTTGPIKWMANEQMGKKLTMKYSVHSDIFSLAVLFYEIFERCRPWSSLSNLEAAHAVMSGERLSCTSSIANDNIRNLMTKMFDKRPRHRPLAASVVSSLQRAVGHLLVDCGDEDYKYAPFLEPSFNNVCNNNSKSNGTSSSGGRGGGGGGRRRQRRRRRAPPSISYQKSVVDQMVNVVNYRRWGQCRVCGASVCDGFERFELNEETCALCDCRYDKHEELIL